MKRPMTISGAAVALALVTTSAMADDYAQQRLKEAMPYMHYSCASLIKEANGDEDFVHDVVSKITFVSLYNHSIDLSEYVKTDEERDALRAVFVDEIRAGCGPDKNVLLAGVIDRSLISSLGL